MLFSKQFEPDFKTMSVHPSFSIAWGPSDKEKQLTDKGFESLFMIKVTT